MGPDTLAVPETVEWGGITYRLMGGKRRYYLSQSRSNTGRRGAKGLHVAVWEFYSGQTVPPGYDVHHRDGNPFNNDYGNLECLSRRHHGATHPVKDAERQKRHLARAREAASAWHRSPEGRAWHRAMALARPKASPVPVVCEWCGDTFPAARPTLARFCGPRCQQQARASVKGWPRHGRNRLQPID